MADRLLFGILFFAGRCLRWEYAFVDGTSFPDETGPLDLGLRNKPDNFTHFQHQTQLEGRFDYAMSNIIPISKIGATGPNCTPAARSRAKKLVTAP